MTGIDLRDFVINKSDTKKGKTPNNIGIFRSNYK